VIEPGSALAHTASPAGPNECVLAFILAAEGELFTLGGVVNPPLREGSYPLSRNGPTGVLSAQFVPAPHWDGGRMATGGFPIFNLAGGGILKITQVNKAGIRARLVNVPFERGNQRLTLTAKFFAAPALWDIAACLGGGD
jgi:hypothetical protein